MDTNTYGLVLNGLIKISIESQNLKMVNSNYNLQLMYDRVRDEVFCRKVQVFEKDMYLKLDDSDIIYCGNLCIPHSIQEVADKVARVLNLL